MLPNKKSKKNSIDKENVKKEIVIEKEVAAEKKVAAGIVIVDRLNVRETPEYNARIIKELKKNERIEILGGDKDFYKIQQGYVMQKFIKV